MAKPIEAADETWLMIPFYTDPKSPEFSKHVAKFRGFVDGAKDITGLKLAVIDDGCGVDNEHLGNAADLLVTIPANRGKAHAIREGLGQLIGDPKHNAGFIVQYDGDGDQPYDAIPSVQRTLVETAKGDRNNPVLVIGDRYSEGLKTTPNPESVVYRQSILTLFGALAGNLGHDGVRDWVSGARGYTEKYAEEFLKRSRSNRYGVESDQLIIATLAGAEVKHAPLSDSRPRDPWTLTTKWLENFDIYDAHRPELVAAGKGHILDLVDELRDGLRSGSQEFHLDLDSLGEATKMRFWRWDNERHAAEIPAEYRAKLFVPDATFPFTLRKDTQEAS